MNSIFAPGDAARLMLIRRKLHDRHRALFHEVLKEIDALEGFGGAKSSMALMSMMTHSITQILFVAYGKKVETVRHLMLETLNLLVAEYELSQPKDPCS